MGFNSAFRGLIICIPHQILFSNQMENNEMGGACSQYGREESCRQGFGGETGGIEVTWKTQA
jgi:hypothetical protein